MGAGSDSVELMHQMMDSTEDARRFLVRSTFYGGTSSPRITEQRRRAFEMGMSMTKTSIRMAREWRRLVEDGPRTRNTAALNLGVRGHLEDRLGGKTHGRPVDSGTSAALAPRDRQHWQQRPTLLMERLLALDEDVLREHFGQPVAPLPVASCAALAPAARPAAVPPPPVEWLQEVAWFMHTLGDWLVLREAPHQWTWDATVAHIDRIARLAWLRAWRRRGGDYVSPMLAVAVYLLHVAGDARHVPDAHGQLWGLWAADFVARLLLAEGSLRRAFSLVLCSYTMPIGLLPALFQPAPVIEAAKPPPPRKRARATPGTSQKAEREAAISAAFREHAGSALPRSPRREEPMAPAPPVHEQEAAWAARPLPFEKEARFPTLKQMDESAVELLGGLPQKRAPGPAAAPWYWTWFHGDERRCWPVPS